MHAWLGTIFLSSWGGGGGAGQSACRKHTFSSSLGSRLLHEANSAVTGLSISGRKSQPISISYEALSPKLDLISNKGAILALIL